MLERRLTLFVSSSFFPLFLLFSSFFLTSLGVVYRHVTVPNKVLRSVNKRRSRSNRIWAYMFAISSNRSHLVFV